MEYLNRFRKILSRLAWFENFSFLQKNSVRSFARFTEILNFWFSSNFYLNRMIFEVQHLIWSIWTIFEKFRVVFSFLWKFCISAEELSQLFCKIHWNFKLLICVEFSFEWIDLRITTLNLKYLDHICTILSCLAWFEDFCISAEELSQLFCRIYRKSNVLIFANKWVDSIGLGIIILNLE